MIKTRIFESTEALITETETLLREILAKPGSLMLSGGSTPYVIYNRIAAAPCPVHPDRKLFLSDERMQPFDSCQNNARNLEPMLKALECENRFIRVDTTLNRADAACKFADDLSAIKSVDLGLLGMGADGHTAGFFTPEQANRKTGDLTLHTDRPAPFSNGLNGSSCSSPANRSGKSSKPCSPPPKPFPPVSPFPTTPTLSFGRMSFSDSNSPVF